jgi:chromosome segregation ATPase
MTTQEIITICFVISTGMGLIGVYIKLIQALDNQEKLIEGIDQRLTTVEYNQRIKLETVADMKNQMGVLSSTVETSRQTIAEQRVNLQQLSTYTTQIFERLKNISDNQADMKESLNQIESVMKNKPTRLKQ